MFCFGVQLFNRLTNYAKYSGILNYVINNNDFHLSHIDERVAVCNLPKEENKEVIKRFDVVISFLGQNEHGKSETQWIHQLKRTKYYNIPVMDYTPPKIEDYLNLIKILERHPKSRILIHCFAGKGRSNCGAVVYLIHHKKMSAEDAIKEVQLRIPRSSMNYWQLQSLTNFDKYYKFGVLN